MAEGHPAVAEPEPARTVRLGWLILQGAMGRRWPGSQVESARSCRTVASRARDAPTSLCRGPRGPPAGWMVRLVGRCPGRGGSGRRTVPVSPVPAARVVGSPLGAAVGVEPFVGCGDPAEPVDRALAVQVVVGEAATDEGGHLDVVDPPVDLLNRTADPDGEARLDDPGPAASLPRPSWSISPAPATEGRSPAGRYLPRRHHKI